VSRDRAAARSLIDFALDLRRVLRRQLADDEPDDLLTPAMSELLHDVAAHPGTGIRAAAARLNLAPNTVSGLVRALVDRGLLERGPDPDDRRATRLSLTAARVERRARRADRRAERLAEHLAGLSPADRAALDAALPVLRALIADLRDEPPRGPGRGRRRMSDRAPTAAAPAPRGPDAPPSGPR
jgi:DNA-binding MarR family transcriptional regulator